MKSWSQNRAVSLRPPSNLFCGLPKTLQSLELLKVFKQRSIIARHPKVNQWTTTRFSCLRRSPLKTSSEVKSSMLWSLRNHQKGIVKSLSWAKNLTATRLLSLKYICLLFLGTRVSLFNYWRTRIYPRTLLLSCHG